MSKASLALRVGVIMVACLAVTPAMAQSYANLGSFKFADYDRGQNASVLQRERPEYAALGIRRGGFLLYPKLATGLGYTDNVLSTATNEKSDTYLSLAPSISAQSDWSRHALQGSAGAETEKFADQTSEDVTNWYVNGVGKLDVVGNSFVQLGSELRSGHLKRSSIGFPALGAEPAKVLYGNIFGRGVYQFGRSRAIGTALYNKTDFDDVRSRAGGTIDMDNRDAKSWRVTGRGEYAVSPDTALFGEVSYAEIDYPTDNLAGSSRNSTDTNVKAGANFDLSALVRGEIGVGYQSRDYADPIYAGVKGLSIASEIEYFPTELTTLSGTLSRGVEDSALSGSGGYLSTAGSVAVDHELLRNVLLRAAVSYENADFKGVDRTDKIYELSVGAKYLLNNSAGLGATLSHGKRESSGSVAFTGPEYASTRFMLSFVLQR